MAALHILTAFANGEAVSHNGEVYLSEAALRKAAPELFAEEDEKENEGKIVLSAEEMEGFRDYMTLLEDTIKELRGKVPSEGDIIVKKSYVDDALDSIKELEKENKILVTQNFDVKLKAESQFLELQAMRDAATATPATPATPATVDNPPAPPAKAGK